MSRRQMARTKYYPNDYDKLKNAPSSFFPSLTYEEFMEWKVFAWDIPSSVCCILRAEDRVSGKITEHVYSRPGAATKKIEKLIETSNITLCNEVAVQVIKPEPITPFTYEHDEPDYDYEVDYE